MAAGHEVRVVPATLVKTLGEGARRTKNDRRDAQVLSEVSCRIDLPSVHVPSKRSREWKTICGMRDVLVSSRRALINNVRGWMRTQGLRIARGETSTFAKRVRVLEPPAFVEAQLICIDTLTEQIKVATNNIKELAQTDPVCQRLMTVPGVGPITSVRFVAAVDDAGRFPSAHRVESYLGLVPGESSSSERQQMLSITKAGPRALRWVLVQAAWSLRHSRCPEALPLRSWAAEIEKRRGTRIATVALARKLAGILFALWRDATTYEPTRAARTVN
jgi:transposase